MNQEIIVFNQVIVEISVVYIMVITIPCIEWIEFRKKVNEINRDQYHWKNKPILCENVQSLSE